MQVFSVVIAVVCPLSEATSTNDCSV